MSSERPRLRAYLEPIPIKLDEAGEVGEAFALKDPFRLAEGSVVLPPAGLALAALFDGTRTIAQVQKEFRRRHGLSVALDEVQGLLQALERAYLLEGPVLERFIAEFARTEVRPAACIGSYPGPPDELRAFLEAQYQREGGPGAGPRNGSTPPAGAVRGIISPHIDMHRGGSCYAWAWREVAESCEAELFVIFGTSHAGTAPLLGGGGGPPPRYALTPKSFETPLGTVATDRDVLERLLTRYAGPDDLLAGEFHHRGEHSIEFQTVYLAHLFAGRRPLRILPVLCGALPGDPAGDTAFQSFHAALREALAGVPPEKVAYVAGIDLAHVGAQFHEPPVSDAALEQVAGQDRETLRLALDEQCPRAVHEDIARDGDPRNICGHAPLVALVEALRPQALRGELLRYDRWYDGESAVSYASAVYRDAEGSPR